METSLLPVKKDKWQREPWLLLVVGGPLLVVCASIFTGVLAFRGADKVVAEDYYKQGLMINKDLQRDARARSMSLHAQLRFDDAHQVQMELIGIGAMPEQVQLSLASAAPDASTIKELVRRVVLHKQAEGRYVANLDAQMFVKLRAAKLLHVKLETLDWRLTGDWFDPSQEQVSLKAAQ